MKTGILENKLKQNDGVLITEVVITFPMIGIH
jgi:hypothetical protein